MQDQRATENPYAAPQMHEAVQHDGSREVSTMAVVWEYVVAVVAFFMLWMIGSVGLMVAVPQAQLQSWEGIGIQLLLLAFAFLLARRHLRSALKEMREGDIEPGGD